MRPKQSALFKGRHFEAETIALCVRWYLRYPLSFRQLEEIIAERNLNVGTRHHHALGPALRAGAEPAVSHGTAEHESAVES